MLRTLFIIEICVDEDTKRYVAGVLAVATKKASGDGDAIVTSAVSEAEKGVAAKG